MTGWMDGWPAGWMDGWIVVPVLPAGWDVTLLDYTWHGGARDALE